MSIDQYLRQATRGLWGKAKTQTWLELRGHLEARAAILESEGHNPDAALQRAIQELGNGTRLNMALAWVHTVPGLLRGLATCALLLVLCAQPLPAMRVLAAPVADETGRISDFRIDATALRDVLLDNGEDLEFSVRYAWRQKRISNASLTDVLTALCNTGQRVRLEPNQNRVAFAFGASRLLLEVSGNQARNWHANHQALPGCVQ